MKAEQYREIAKRQGTGPVPMPKPKPAMDKPLQNLRNAVSTPTSRFPQRVNLPEEQ